MHRTSTMKTITLLGLVVFGLFAAPATVRADAADSYRQSYVLEARGDFSTALTRIEDVRKQTGPSYFLSLRSGWLHYLAGNYDAAERLYREAIAAKPGAIEARIGLTVVLYVSQRWKPLETACKSVLAEDAKHAAVRARLAASYYNRGNYPDAAAIYRPLIDSYPAELDYQTGYAWAILRMGKRDEARRIFQAVLAVSPDNPNAIQGLAAR